LSIYIVLVLFFVLVLVLVTVILLYFYSVLVLVIVTKISLSIAILFYALVYDDDDDDDAGLSSSAGTNLKVGGTCQARSAGKFLSCPYTFLALQVQSVVLVSASMWSVQFDHFLVFFVLTVGAPVPSHLKVEARTPVPWMESASLSCYSFTPESIIKQPFNLNA